MPRCSSRADVGIAMGALGSDAAIEAADVVLMDDDPAKIALAMRIARRTLRIVYQNIVFALAIKVYCLVLGAIGMASMWTAIFADVGVMVLAVLNAACPPAHRDLAKRMNGKKRCRTYETVRHCCPHYMSAYRRSISCTSSRFFFDIKFSSKHAGRCFQLFPDQRISDTDCLCPNRWRALVSQPLIDLI